MEIISSKPVGGWVLKDLLEKRSKDEELGYEQQQSAEYLEKFSKLKAKDAEKLVAELKKNSKVTEETAIKIAELLPKQADTLKAILAKDKVELNDEEIASVLASIKEYL